jgi:hypothetical protein
METKTSTPALFAIRRRQAPEGVFEIGIAEISD